MLSSEINFKSLTVYITLPPTLHLVMVMMSLTLYSFNVVVTQNNKFLRLVTNVLSSFCRQIYALLLLAELHKSELITIPLQCSDSTLPQQNYFLHMTGNSMETSF